MKKPIAAPVDLTKVSKAVRRLNPKLFKSSSVPPVIAQTPPPVIALMTPPKITSVPPIIVRH